MAHEMAKEWAARPGAVVRYWDTLHREWQICVGDPCWAKDDTYTIFDGRHNVLVSIGPDAEEPDLGDQMLESLGAPTDATIRIVRDGVVVGKPHPLQADIVKWAGDPERWGWEFRCSDGVWSEAHRPPLEVSEPARWRLIDRHAPKGPLTEVPEEGAEYWLASVFDEDFAEVETWGATEPELRFLRQRLCFRTREEAAALGRRMAEVAMEGER